MWTYRDLSYNNTIIAKDLSLIADWRRSFDGNVGGGISSIHRFPIELKNINSTFFSIERYTTYDVEGVSGAEWRSKG